MFIVIVSTLASYAVAWIIGVPILVPFLNAAAAWWVMARELRHRQTRRAIAVMLVWALTMGLVATAMAASGWSRRRDGGDLFLRSWYRDQMLHWVQTGLGPESQPSVFIPAHIAHLAVFSAASLSTGGLLAMPMGAMLVNQMAEYVGVLAARSAHPVSTAVLGWHPWAVVRVIGFVMIGVVLSGVLLSRVMSFPFALSRERSWLQIGAALVALDLVLKLVLAPAWARILRGLAGW